MPPAGDVSKDQRRHNKQRQLPVGGSYRVGGREMVSVSEDPGRASPRQRGTDVCYNRSSPSTKHSTSCA